MMLEKCRDGSSLVEVVDRILDKGIVIDVFARISVLGIELITVEARIVVSSIETWLRYADAVDLLKSTEDVHDPNNGQSYREPKDLLDNLRFQI
ncbi:gas vesicle structural protein GvpA [Bacillus sp. SJS]|uniref:gas vesicle structural protein GvpA n=1 Tax=Bacillus sp. SJS TaxID=1423321 RepID=UPI0004DCD65E|nr:gas vesicle structural protein GvpA [Bacillus sp. SJS]KZZ83463.1 gas vesicle protein GvpA [Bacillus sp. SJS]